MISRNLTPLFLVVISWFLASNAFAKDFVPTTPPATRRAPSPRDEIGPSQPHVLQRGSRYREPPVVPRLNRDSSSFNSPPETFRVFSGRNIPSSPPALQRGRRIRDISPLSPSTPPSTSRAPSSRKDSSSQPEKKKN